MLEILDLVDENDLIIGTIDRKKVYAEQIHNIRVIGIFLIDESGKILVQRRTKTRSYCPNGYDFSVAGHVLSGESYEEAARREAIEELGVELPDLEEFLYCGYPNKYQLAFFSKYYIAKCPPKGQIIFDTNEVSDIEYMSLDEIRQKMNDFPHMFKSDYKPAFEELCKYLENRALDS